MGIKEMSSGRIKLDANTKEINIYGASIKKASQDKLGRVHITVR